MSVSDLQKLGLLRPESDWDPKHTRSYVPLLLWLRRENAATRQLSLWVQHHTRQCRRRPLISNSLDCSLPRKLECCDVGREKST